MMTLDAVLAKARREFDAFAAESLERDRIAMLNDGVSPREVRAAQFEQAEGMAAVREQMLATVRRVWLSFDAPSHRLQ